MLSSTYRLPKEEITHVLRRGMHVRNDVVELIYRKTNTVPSRAGDTSRFTFIVSTKIDKRATVRNRMRRTMSESVRHLLPKLTAMDGIFVAKKNFADMGQTDVQVIVEELFKKAGV